MERLSEDFRNEILNMKLTKEDLGNMSRKEKMNVFFMRKKAFWEQWQENNC